MSQANVDALRPIYEEWARGNFEPGRELLDEEVVFVTFTPEQDDLTYRRPAGVAKFMREFLTQWKDYRVVAEEFIDRDPHVLVVCRQSATGRQSGAQVEMSVYCVWSFRRERAVRVLWTRHRDRALEAVGLRE